MERTPAVPQPVDARSPQVTWGNPRPVGRPPPDPGSLPGAAEQPRNVGWGEFGPGHPRIGNSRAAGRLTGTRSHENARYEKGVRPRRVRLIAPPTPSTSTSFVTACPASCAIATIYATTRPSTSRTLSTSAGRGCTHRSSAYGQHGARSAHFVAQIRPGALNDEDVVKRTERCPTCGASLWYYAESPTYAARRRPSWSRKVRMA